MGLYAGNLVTMSHNKPVIVGPGEKLFDIEGEPMPSGAWWWWFWLFFFDNPKDPEKPRQLMILWSTKNVKEIDCNGLDIKLQLPIDRKNMDGAVAAWYYDGEKMHHNFLLEQCKIKVVKDGLSTDSKTPTSFTIRDIVNRVQIGDKFDFVAEAKGTQDFLRPTYHANNFVGSKGYAITRINKLDLKGMADGKPIKGTAYFQRVFVNAPAVPWYWGTFHFANGAALTYTNHRVFRKAIKKQIVFFDGQEAHLLKDITVKRTGGEIPVFKVSGETSDAKASFTVSPYAHSSWTFKKKSLGIIPNKLVYNEYPATITEFEFVDKKTGKKTTPKELGKSVGNAEHTTGYLL